MNQGKPLIELLHLVSSAAPAFGIAHTHFDSALR